MFCSKCGTDLPDDSQFCRKCGQGVGSVSVGGGAAAAVAPAPTAAAKPKRKTAVWIAAIFLLVAAWAGWQRNVHGYYGANPAHEQTAHPQPQLHSQAIGDVAFTINAGASHYYEFTVPAGAYDASLKGHFSATGGSGNDIEVYVLSQDNYINWQNGHRTSALYNSGRVTQQSISVSLPSGAATYYLLFDNRYSILSPKAIKANVSLTYYTR